MDKLTWNSLYENDTEDNVIFAQDSNTTHAITTLIPNELYRLSSAYFSEHYGMVVSKQTFGSLKGAKDHAESEAK